MYRTLTRARWPHAPQQGKWPHKIMLYSEVATIDICVVQYDKMSKSSHSTFLRGHSYHHVAHDCAGEIHTHELATCIPPEGTLKPETPSLNPWKDLRIAYLFLIFSALLLLNAALPVWISVLLFLILIFYGLSTKQITFIFPTFFIE